MSDIETLKLKDTKLINQICDLGDITIDKRRRWSIEFDDYGMSNVIDAIRADERAKFKAEVIEALPTLEQTINGRKVRTHCKSWTIDQILDELIDLDNKNRKAIEEL